MSGELSIGTARVYGYEPAEGDCAVLVDRLWPRGVAKAALPGVAWDKDVAPSEELRRRFHHEGMAWGDFRRTYEHELAGTQAPRALLERARESGRPRLVLLFGAKDTEHNNARVLADYLGKLTLD
ncbi:DUF488 family protein [Brevibacterium sp. BRM-1]|uniref:DUF488 domain-containing protein n=1 Tax=Brevibacterium sp. BRM-1 TaxID=2999062 RepID=UPI00227F402E|nr:DUF488 family protein [Brevibacterium sp. BRM-1]WAL40074.1 DUF488 family protein [Brevibacterium sp. BRM-1]